MNWKPVKGYEGLYEVSDAGDVFSVRTGRMMKSSMTSHGYMRVVIQVDGKQSMKHCHRLVAEAFIPNPDNLPQVNHIDGNRLNNHVSNLEWCTPSENLKHAYRTGLKKRKLTDEDITFIRIHYIPRHPDFGTRGLGRRFGVTQVAISHVIHMKGGDVDV